MLTEDFFTSGSASEVPYGMVAIGTCGKCGGPVCVTANNGSVLQETPRCTRCGSVPATRYGPTIPMAEVTP